MNNVFNNAFVGKNVCIINGFDTYEHRVDLLYSFFKKHGANVKVFASDFRHFEKCKRNDVKENFTFIEATPYKKNLSLARMKSHVSLSRRIFKGIRDLDFDLVWVLVPPNSFVKDTAFYKKNHQNAAIVFDLIDLWPETMPITKVLFWPLLNFWRRLRDKHLNIADIIVTECNLYKRKIPKSIDQAKVHTIYLARKIETFDQILNLPNKRISLCYLGSINNIIDIESIGLLLINLKKYYPVDVHIIGDGEKKNDFIKTCENSGATVFFYGKIYDKNKKQKIFNSCHYGINFMKGSVFVGLTMKSIDYFEAGLPIINNIHGDTWDFVEKDGIGFNIGPNTNYESIATYNFETRRITRKFYEEHFSIETMENRLLDVLGTVFK